jgi:hypothetical protein
MKERTGSVFQNRKLDGTRVNYTATNGKRTAVQQTAESKSAAKKALKELLEKLNNGYEPEADKLTFNDLANCYESLR